MLPTYVIVIMVCAIPLLAYIAIRLIAAPVKSVQPSAKAKKIRGYFSIVMIVAYFLFSLYQLLMAALIGQIPAFSRIDHSVIGYETSPDRFEVSVIWWAFSMIMCGMFLTKGIIRLRNGQPFLPGDGENDTMI